MSLVALALMAAASQTGEATCDLVEKLGSDDIREREESSVALKALGAAALDSLVRATGNSDPEIAGRARELLAALLPRLSPEEVNRIPFESLDLADIDLHTLTVRIRGLVGKEILWTEDLGLRKRRVHLVSDVPLKDEAELLFKVYQSILQSNDLVLVPVSSGEEKTFKVRPSPGRRPRAPEDRVTTRLIFLRKVGSREAQSALMNIASFPQCILRPGPGNLLLVTDTDESVRRIQATLEFMERSAE